MERDASEFIQMVRRLGIRDGMVRYTEIGLDDLIQEKKEEEFIMIEVIQKDIWWIRFGYAMFGRNATNTFL